MASSPLPLALFSFVRINQSEHGLKHSEYTRYRQYCARKLRKLLKGANLVQASAKGKYVKRTVHTDSLDDERLLQVPLVAAERAWAYAMDIKNEIEQSKAPHKRRHMLKRLTKAHGHAKELAGLVAARSHDTRSTVEADAYLHWIAGSLYLEKGNNWEMALQKLGHAQNVLNELSKVSDYDQRVNIRYMLDKVEPAVRFCEYQLSRAGASFTTPTGCDAMGAAMASKFKELSEAARASGVSFGGPGGVGGDDGIIATSMASTGAGSSDEVQWNGESYPVFEGRCKAKVHAAQALVLAVSDLEGNGCTLEEVIQLHDRIVNAYASARDAVRAATQLGSITEAQQLQLVELGRAINGVQLEWTIKRNVILAKAMEDRLSGALLQSIVAGPASSHKEKMARPDEIVRTYENLIANVTALNDLAAESGGAQGEILMDHCAAWIEQYKACRCYFIAHKYLSDRMYAEAHGLFERCLKRCTTAASLVDESAKVDMGAKQELAELTNKARAFGTVCVAEYKSSQLEQSDAAADAVGKVSLEDQHGGATATTMVDKLDTWESFVDASSARISRIPPPVPFIPVRPIVLDNAIVGIEPPNLDHRVIEEPSSTTSVVSRIFGWS